MAKTHKVTVKHAVFRYYDPETGGRRYAFSRQEIEVGQEDFERGSSADAFYTDKELKAPTTAPAAAPATAGGSDPYDEMNVGEAVSFLTDLPEDQREAYFEKERSQQRKGVLEHFDQPLWEGA